MFAFSVWLFILFVFSLLSCVGVLCFEQFGRYFSQQLAGFHSTLVVQRSISITRLSI